MEWWGAPLRGHRRSGDGCGRDRGTGPDDAVELPRRGEDRAVVRVEVLDRGGPVAWTEFQHSGDGPVRREPQHLLQILLRVEPMQVARGQERAEGAEPVQARLIREERNRFTRTRPGRSPSRWPQYGRWKPPAQPEVRCSFGGSGGTVMRPRGRANSVASRRARVAAQFMGASSR